MTVFLLCANSEDVVKLTLLDDILQLMRDQVYILIDLCDSYHCTQPQLKLHYSMSLPFRYLCVHVCM